jgi:DNA-binding beta-propeller fold protein YncE
MTTPAGTILVADSFHHRIVEVDSSGTELWELGASSPADPGLLIPRSAIRRRDGSTVVADGVNGRIVVANRDGRTTSEISAVRTGIGRSQLGDPHHVEAMGTNLLITDSFTNTIWLIDEAGRAVRRWGHPDLGWFNDPHSAHLRRDGSLVVADAGNGRIAICPARVDAEPIRVRFHSSSGDPVSLDYPRFVLPDAYHELIVVDTDAAQILVARDDGALLATLGPLLHIGSSKKTNPELRTPRWVAFDRASRLLVTDYWNSRVLVLGSKRAIRTESARQRGESSSV